MSGKVLSGGDMAVRQMKSLPSWNLHFNRGDTSAHRVKKGWHFMLWRKTKQVKGNEKSQSLRRGFCYLNVLGKTWHLSQVVKAA